jgi:hypothetical protein
MTNLNHQPPNTAYWCPLSGGAAGADGAAGRDGIGIPGWDGEEGIPSMIPGPTGQPGATPVITLIPGPPGDDGEYWFVPGINGLDGAVGAIGPMAPIIPGRDGEDGDSFLIPGPPGLAGADGVSPPWVIIPGRDGEDGDSFLIPGPKGDTGAAGGGGGGTMTAFTQDLGTAKKNGTFDITGLAGLTADKVVTVVQTAAQIASKGNARDEPEWDLIVLTGYVFDAVTIRVYWNAPGIVTGTYAFAYAVAA